MARPLLTNIRKWFTKASPPAPTASFAVSCGCGQLLTGMRTAAAQHLACAKCHEIVFVLPAGPWLELAKNLSSPASAAPPRLTRRDLLLPIAASALALAVLVFAYRQWVAPLLFPVKNDVQGPTVHQASLPERLARGQKLLAEGSFRLAVLEMSPDDRVPDLSSLDNEQRRAWKQTYRQAALLADLVAEPLEELLRHAATTKEQEWQAEFRQRYQGKSLVLDAEFRRRLDGRWEVHYPLFQGDERSRLVVDDLKILGQVPPQQPQRLLIGMRLAAIVLEPPGPTWVVRVEPDSGVFLTDPTAAARVCPAFNEPEALMILERQARWVE